jgi:hypothetical protein
MQLPNEAKSLIAKVDAVFKRANLQSDIEVQSDYAKYLVVRICGLVEKVVLSVVEAHTAARSNPTITRHVMWRMGTFQNLSLERLLQLAGSFDKKLRTDLEIDLTDPERLALSSVVAHRHSIAHGGDSTISLGQIIQYHKEVVSLLEKFAAKF